MLLKFEHQPQSPTAPTEVRVTRGNRVGRGPFRRNAAIVLYRLRKHVSMWKAVRNITLVLAALALVIRLTPIAGTALVMIPAFVATFLVSVISTGWIRDLAIRRKIVDAASSVRKVHVKAIPRLGGIAFVFSWYACVAVVLAADAHARALVEAHAPRSFVFLAGGLVIALMGAFDDLLGMRARHKLLIQIAVAAMLCASGAAVHAIQLPTGTVLHLGWFAWPFTMMWVIGVMNAMNLIDGLDGLAGGIAEVALGCIIVLSVALALPILGLYATLLAGAVLGFLLFNFNPASIFMGDCGSLFLGYFLAVALCVSSEHPGTGASELIVPVLVLGVPVADTLLAVFRRTLSGKALFSADRGHIHHRLIARGLSHRRAVIVLYLVCMTMATAGVAIAFSSPRWAALILTAPMLVLGWVVRRFGLISFDLKALRRDRRRNLELRSAVSAIANQIKDARNLAQVKDSLTLLLPAVLAAQVTTRLSPAGDEHSLSPVGDGVLARFPVQHGKTDLGYVQVRWTDGRPKVDAEHALAMEELCGHVARVVRRLTPTEVKPVKPARRAPRRRTAST
jgi:UDP-GlcNAc:undecaprenyl-phosphate GlcNAc-1-phosphate transferase